jgi:hypothetical protein
MVNLFVRALIVTTIIVAVTDAIEFYVVWRGKAKITPLFVVLVIIVTMVPMAINLWINTMVNLFVRALIVTTIIVAVTDAIEFYVVWRGKAKITPLFVILVIIVTMVPVAINLWVHIFR